MQSTIEHIVALNQFFTTYKDKAMSIQTAYKMNKIREALRADSQFIQEQWQKIIQEYSTPNENGENVVLPEKVDECNTKINELMSTAAEIPDIYFTLDELSNIELTPEQLRPLMPLIQE